MGALDDRILYCMSIVDWEETGPQTFKGHFGKERHLLWKTSTVFEGMRIDAYAWQVDNEIHKSFSCGYGQESKGLGVKDVQDLYENAARVCEARKGRRMAS